MIKQIASLLFGFLSAAQPVNAQTDQPESTANNSWMIYDRVASDGLRLVVLTRAGNPEMQSLLRNGGATVVTCQAEPANINEYGMPQGTNRLYALEDELAAAPSLLAARAIHIASVTGQGQRRIFILHADPLDLSPLLAAMQIQGFSCEASPVEDRQVLIQLVTPTPLESALCADQDVIAVLQKNGDDGSSPRETNFWFYGQRAALDTLIAALEPHGFSVNHWMSEPDGVVLSREMPTDLQEFNMLTPVILDIADYSGVDYTGWETKIIPQTSAEPDQSRCH